VKICEAAEEALRIKEKRAWMELSFPPKLVEKTSLVPSYFVL
jgi:hypothetical protein